MDFISLPVVLSTYLLYNHREIATTKSLFHCFIPISLDVECGNENISFKGCSASGCGH